MEFKFERLKIWQIAMEFGERIHKVVENFPPTEVYSLSQQIRRAVDSIALNISEGAILQSAAEFKRFMGYAIRSLAEVVTCLHKAKRRDYINEVEFNANYEIAFNLMNMMIAFKEKVK